MSISSSIISDLNIELSSGGDSSIETRELQGRVEDLLSFGNIIITTDTMSLDPALSHVSPTAKAHEACFSRTVAVTDEELKQKEVVVKRDKRGDEGSKEYIRHFKDATEALDGKFGVSQHLISEGDEEDGNDKHTHLHELFVSNINKIEEFDHRLIKYDMKYVVVIPRIKNRSAAHPKDRWGPMEEARDLLEEYGSIPLDEVQLWQADTNRYGDAIAQQSVHWLNELTQSNSTSEMKDRVKIKYNKAGVESQGGILRLYLTLCEMMVMSRDVKAALKKFVNGFKEKGLTSFRGENVNTARKTVVAACRKLHDAGDLPEETVADVLSGLSKGSVKDFTKLFGSLGDLEKLNMLTSSPQISGSTTFELVKSVFDLAVDNCSSLQLGGKWHVPKSNRAANVSVPRDCWNCGKTGCNARTCPEPRNQKRIDENKKKFEEARRRARGGRSSGGGNGGGRGSGGYQRSKWGNSDATEGKGGLRFAGGVPQCFCKNCGWNTTHSSGFHAAWIASPSAFRLPDTHPYMQLLKKQAAAMNQAQGSSVPPPPLTATGTTTSGDSLVISRSRAKAALDSLETNSANPDTAEICGALRSLLGIN